MRTLLHTLAVMLTLVLVTTTIKAQVLDPNDPIVEYNPNNPPSLPANGNIGKWVRTDRLNWNTDSYKSYIYRGSALLPFRLKFPKNYNPQDNKKYPLIIMLHGAGEKGTIYDNEYNLLHGGQIHRNAVDNGQFDGFVMFPQSTGAWYDDYYNALTPLINRLVNEANVDPFRISMHGLSNGGKGVWEYFISNTLQFAAILPMSATSSGNSTVLNRIKYTPIWNSQGGLDTNPTPSGSRTWAETIWNVGGNMRYTLYPELGHGVWNTHYAEPDFFPFMMRANKVNPWPLFERTEFCPGDPISVRLGVTPGFENYQWRKNSAVISGANSNELLVTTVGVYDVRVMRNGVWSYWSPIPIEVKVKETTQTPPIQLAALHSKVIPSPDGRNFTTLELPEGFEQYEWKKVGSSAVIGTNRTLNATTPGDYTATVTERFGCSSVPSAPFTVINANGANGPSAAVGVTATTLSKTSIRVAWSDNPNAPFQETGFEVYRGTQSGGPYSFINLTGANVFSFTDTNLLPGTKYFYIVRAVNGNAASSSSNQASTTTTSDTEPPTAPLNLSIIAATDNSVYLAWDVSTDDVGLDKYIVYRNGVQSLITSENEATIFNLTPHQVYNFTVKARDLTGNLSAASNQVTVATVANGLKYDYYEGSFDVLPDFNTMTPVSSGQVDNFTLSVREQNDNFALKFEGKINIPTNGNYTFYTTSDDGSKLYIDGFSAANQVVNNDGLHGNQERSGTRNLTAGSHTIIVTFFEAGGGETLQVRWQGPGISKQLIPDNAMKDNFVIPGQPPATPSQLAATAVSYNQINLTWTDNSNNETGFQIYRATNPTGPYYPIAITNPNVTSYQNKELNANTTYYYRIQAIGQYGQSGFSTVNGVNYAEYYGSWSNLPDFNSLTPVNTGVVSTFSIAPRTRNDDFAFKFDGFINIPTSGNYTFYTTSDDGSKLYIGGYSGANQVVNNDGLHGNQERNGSRNLTAGTYPITVTFFEAGGGENLEVRWRGPGISKQLIPASALKEPDVNATTLPLPAGPNAPTNLTAEAVSNIRINLSWNDNSNDENKFEIFRSASNNNNYLLIATLPSNNTATVNYSDAELFPGVTYFYKVVASNVGGSSTSNEVSDTTPTNIPDSNDPPVLTAIEDILIGSGETMQINITAEDDPADVVTLTAVSLPSFANFADQGSGNGILTLNPTVSDVGEYQNITIVARDDKGGESSEVFSITVFNSTIDKYYVNFTATSQFSEASPWNNFITNGGVGSSLNNLNDDIGNTSGISISLLDGWNGTNNEGMNTGNNSGVVPDNVMLTSIWVSSSINKRIRVSGLENDRYYNFIFFASRNGTGNRIISYTINGNTVSLNASLNTQNTVQIDGVLPVNGEVIINASKNDGSSYGYINSIVIEGYSPDEINADPTELKAAGISNSAIGLSWKDNSPNETGFQVWRSTSSNGTYSLINTTGVNATSYTDNNVTANTMYYYKVRAMINGEGTGYTNVSSATTVSYSVSINFNFDNPQAAPWNNTNANSDPGFMLSNLKTNTNANSGITMTIVAENPAYNPAIYGFTGNNPSGMNTGNNSGVVPDNVMRSTHYLDPGRVAEIKISGMDISSKYNFVFFASRNGTGNRTTDYAIGGEVVSLNASLNINNTVQINGVIPDNNGEAIIKISPSPGALYGYIGAVIIQSYPSEDHLNARYASKNDAKTTGDILDEGNEIAGKSLSVFETYPNPVEEQLTIKVIEGNTDRNVNVILRDNMGRILYNSKATFDESGSLQLDLNDKSISSGLLMLEIFYDGGERKVFRLIKK